MEYNIPKKVWFYWHQGKSEMPEISRRCYDSWEKFNPGWELNFLHEHNLKDYVDISKSIYNFENKNIQIQGFSDILRISLLKKYGGVWVDSTCFCTKPLNNWIFEYSSENDFFVFSNPGFDCPGEEKVADSWFIASSDDNYLLNKWYFETINYWNRNQTNDRYFWFHSLFNKLYKNDNKFKQKWDKSKKIDCHVDKNSGPHLFVPYHKNMNLKLNDKWKRFIDQDDTPLYKLNWKVNFELNNNTVVDYLFNKLED